MLLAWHLPYGRQLLYPLTLLATYAHELGHGLTAVLMGFEFEQLYLHADGSSLPAAGGQVRPAIPCTAYWKPRCIPPPSAPEAPPLLALNWCVHSIDPAVEWLSQAGVARNTG